jgi:tRNA (guanosine-2'-O-)-methyltransferase
MEQVIAERTSQIAVVAEHLYDVGNISAVMRSAESYGFLPFRIIERPEAKYKKSDRISRGTEKWLDIRKSKDTVAAVRDLKTQGYQVFASDLSATHTLQQIDFSKKTAIVFGNERDGISEDMRREATGTFLIPMYGFAQSFNISVAAAICFSYIHQERVKKLGHSGDLSEEERRVLKAHYLLRTLDSGPEILLARRT